MKPIKPRNRAIYFSLFSILFVVAIPFLVLYSMGYSFSSWFSITSRGGLYVFVSESDSDIYINQKLEKTTGAFQKELFLQNLKPGAHFVLVANKDFWPWAKYVAVREKEVTALFPLLVRRDLPIEPVATTSTKAVNELFKISNTTSTSTATSTPKEIGLTKRGMQIWNDEKNIFARWHGGQDRLPAYFCSFGTCEDVIKVFSTLKQIQHIDFYPGRDDAIIMSVGGGIFAIELDVRPYQNTYPIYQGQQPDFRVEGSRLYIKDGSFVGQMTGF